MRLLLVEDEEKTSAYIKRALKELGFNVDVSVDGLDGLHLAMEHDYEAIILDVMLPGLDGYSILDRLRGHKNTPVIMLSAKGSVEERVKGLRHGADDYLCKPFSLSELVARIQALLRRQQVDGAEMTHLSIHDLQLDLIARKVTRGNDRLELTAKEFALLSLLVRNQGKILSKMMIAEQIWDMNFDSDTNVVEVAVKRLRSKVDLPYTEKLIHTVRGMGYVLETRD
ncbi:heavy metal response regulator transcription factor [Marinomonas pontica]|uniref:heavy metal response regulator transcription factor n=1 Tax=Marinomonas pontica TaxID=264739 RepID=UPI0022446E78|nr:heavy metal response regulator transcription factor [Marinomonas pontica]MCW8356283.1 heavy metal response regulator transcription factor [Marinomonas pontica]